MQLAWATDIHLNFLAVPDRRQFLESIPVEAEALLLAGDIAESNSLGIVFEQIEAIWRKPVYFVLGNHDFYRGSIAGTRAEVDQVIRRSRNLVYLSQAGVVELTPRTALVGHDGWGDTRLGDYEGSGILLNDFLLIEDLRYWKGAFVLDKPALRPVLQSLGDEAARYLEGVMEPAAGRYAEVIVVTHIPPFREAAWYEGRPSDDDYLPFFSCKAVGDVLLRIAQSHPQTQFLVLCGHTHGGGEVEMRANLRVVTGQAEYGHPRVQTLIGVE